MYDLKLDSLILGIGLGIVAGIVMRMVWTLAQPTINRLLGRK